MKGLVEMWSVRALSGQSCPDSPLAHLPLFPPTASVPDAKITF